MDAKKILPEATFIYVTHNINDAMQLSNKIMVIHEGRILQFNDKQVVFEFPNSSIVADYMWEGNNKYFGVIKDGFFINDTQKIELDEFQLASLYPKTLDNIICYSLGEIVAFFDENGNTLTGFRRALNTKTTIYDDELLLFGTKYSLGDLKHALVKKGEATAILDVDSFILEKKDNCLDVKGKVVFVSSKYLIVSVNEIPITFINKTKHTINDEITIYYPMEKLKAIDDHNEQIISSYIISNNITKGKIINSKKGLVKLINEKFTSQQLIGIKGIVECNIPLDAFIFDDDGKYCIDTLYNEENLGNKTLIHFSCKKINNYLSALVDNPFLGYNMNKIRFDFDINKIKFSNKKQLKNVEDDSTK
jgi:hypothetical protein